MTIEIENETILEHEKGEFYGRTLEPLYPSIDEISQDKPKIRAIVACVLREGDSPDSLSCQLLTAGRPELLELAVTRVLDSFTNLRSKA